jgi:hypothetical protein
MGWLIDGIMDWLVRTILNILDGVLGLISEALLVTPDVTVLPQVQALTGRSIWIVDTIFVLAFIAAGTLTMLAGGDERSRYTVKDLLPRAIVGFVAAHFSQLIVSKLIELANGLTGALAINVNRDSALGAVRTHLHAASDRTVPLLFAVLASIIIVLVVSTAFSMIVRFAILLVLASIAPVALGCHALPQTDPAARLWWRCFFGCAAVPTLQACSLTAGHWMLLDPAHLLPVFGLPVEPGGVFNLLIVIVLLWTTVRIPGLVRRYVTQGGRTPNFLGMVVRVVVVQQLSRAVPGLGRGVRAVTR